MDLIFWGVSHHSVAKEGAAPIGRWLTVAPREPGRGVCLRLPELGF